MCLVLFDRLSTGVSIMLEIGNDTSSKCTQTIHIDTRKKVESLSFMHNNQQQDKLFSLSDHTGRF